MRLKEAVTILKTIDVCDLRELCDVTEETYDEAICVVLDKIEKLKKENKRLKTRIEEYKYTLSSQQYVIRELRDDIDMLEDEIYGGM